MCSWAAPLCREVYERLGGYDEQLGLCGDYEFTLRIADQVRSVHVPSHLASIRFHPASLTSNRPWGFFREVAQARRRHGGFTLGNLAGSARDLGSIALYVLGRPIWTSDAWRRLRPSAKRL